MGPARYLIILLGLLLYGCGGDPYLKVGIGTITNEVPTTGGPAFMSHLGVTDGKKYCEWSHFSMVNRGSPWDNRSEPALDFVGCGFMFGGPPTERHHWLSEGIDK